MLLLPPGERQEEGSGKWAFSPHPNPLPEGEGKTMYTSL